MRCGIVRFCQYKQFLKTPPLPAESLFYGLSFELCRESSADGIGRGGCTPCGTPPFPARQLASTGETRNARVRRVLSALSRSSRLADSRCM